MNNLNTSRSTLIGLLILCALVGSTSNAQISGVDYQWELQRDNDDIQIYTSEVADSKFKAVRGVSTAKGSIESAVALVLDLEACPKWADLCEKSKQVKKISDTESFVYTLNNLPFPVNDRDVVAKVVWQRDASGRVSMTSTATDSTLVPKTDAVRLKDAVAQWHFSQQDEQTVLIESFGHIDPNGATPAWITNMLLVDSPFKSIQKMRRQIESGKYQNQTIPF